MSFTTAEHLSELTKKDIGDLALLLNIPLDEPFTEEWFKQQAQVMSKFPAKLLKPKNPFSRLGLMLGLGAQQATLCKCHKALNPRLIRRIFLLLSKEVTVRNMNVGKYPCHENVHRWLKRVQKINSLWMSADMYRTAFQVDPSEHRYDRVASECEACILARIGGDSAALLDLDVSAWSRRRRDHVPRILRFTDAWLDFFESNQEIYDHNRALAKDVNAARKFYLEKRRAEARARSGSRKRSHSANSEGSRSNSQGELSRNHSRGQPPDRPDPFAHVFGPQNPFADPAGNEKDDDEHDDTEAPVYDFYQSQLSQAKSSGRGDPHPDGMHSAFRNPPPSDIRPYRPYPLAERRNSEADKGRSHTKGQAADRGRSLDRASSSKGTSSPSRKPFEPVRLSAYSASIYSQPSLVKEEARIGGAYDSLPYIAPLRTPAKKPIREPKPPPTSNKFFPKEVEKDTASNRSAINKKPSSIWTDVSVHTEPSVVAESSTRLPSTRDKRNSDEQRAKALRALEGQPSNRRPALNSVRKSRTGDNLSQLSQNTTWGNFCGK